MTGLDEGLTAAEVAVCDRLTGKSVPMTAGVIAAARRHRVHLLVAASLSPEERRDDVSAELLRELRTAAVSYVRREALLRLVIEHLTAERIGVLVFKGAALACTVYPEPHLRPRVDVDLLVARHDLDRADRILIRSGWTPAVEPGGELVSGQRHYQHPRAAATVEHLDLHWRIANPAAFAQAPSFDALQAGGVEIPALGPSARTPGPADSLFVACVHLVAHHGGEPAHLLWLFDLHLLAARLDEEERAHFVEVASDTAMRAVCRRGLEAAHACYGGAATAALAAALPDPDQPEPLRRLTVDVSRAQALRADLAALPTWSARATLMRQHLFPSMAYVREKYPTWPAPLLPLAVLHRIMAGAPRWFDRRRR